MHAIEFRKISRNFAAAKVGSCLMIIAAHHFPGTVLWVPAVVGLFVFGYASGFFTAARYTGPFSLRPFWGRKMQRLGWDLLVIDSFLLILFLAQGTRGLTSWHTLLSLFGLNGFLDWLGIPNRSPYGAGLWFFTLLLLFYLVYPVLERINRRRAPACALLAVSVPACLALHYLLPMNHTLWMTALSFILGVFAFRYRPSVHIAIPTFTVLASALAMLLLNLHKVYVLDFPLVLTGAVGLVMCLTTAALPDRFVALFIPLSGCLLEMYAIHWYLFTGSERLSKGASFAISLLLTIACAWLLSRTADGLRRLAGALRRRC